MKKIKSIIISAALAVVTMLCGCDKKVESKSTDTTETAETTISVSEIEEPAEQLNDTTEWDESTKTIANYTEDGTDENGGRLMYPVGDFKTFKRIVCEYAEVSAKKIKGSIVPVVCDITEDGKTIDRTVTFFFDIDEVIKATHDNTPLVVKTKTNAILVCDGVTMEKMEDGGVAVWYGGYLFE